MKKSIWEYSPDELRLLMEEAGAPRYRSRQLMHYLYQQKETSFANMLLLPRELREFLHLRTELKIPEVVKKQTSSDKKATKILLRMEDGALVETVCMHHIYGNSVCVSTQVGCAMGCIFCASTLKGKERNLTAGEMMSQVYAFLRNGVRRIHSIVLMGAGEPLDNYEESLRFIRQCHEPDVLDMSYRNITLSTVGIIPGIRRLAEEKLPITLAVSLHAPNDAIRNRILPASRRYPMKDLLEAVSDYVKTAGRRVTFEYILISGVNDGAEQAEQLGEIARHIHCHINLIPVNGNEHIRLFPPDEASLQRFHNILVKSRRSVTTRRKMGDEIQAACGQLKRRYQSEEPQIDGPEAK